MKDPLESVPCEPFDINKFKAMATMIDEAVAVERERCAKIADEHWKMNEEPKRKAPGWDSACILIAAAIRKGE